MKQNVIIALLSIIATLLVVREFNTPNFVIGQSSGGGSASIGTEIAVATGTTQGGSVSAFYMYHGPTNRLAVYILGSKGLELRSVRDLQYDLQIPDFNSSRPGVITSVKEVQGAVNPTPKKKR